MRAREKTYEEAPNFRLERASWQIEAMAANLEKRVDALERELKSLKSAVRESKKKGLWWERLAGTFKDDPLFDEMVEAGRKYRRS